MPAGPVGECPPLTAEATVAALPIRRNTLLLGAAMAVFSAVLPVSYTHLTLPTN